MFNPKNTTALLYAALRFSLAFLLFTATARAQQPQGGQDRRPGGGPGGNAPGIGRFYGKVVDEATGKGLGYASVQLLGMRVDTATRARQEVLVAGQLTEENGDFSLENLPVRGEFTLKVSFMGYAAIERKVSFGAPGQQPAAFEKDLGNIALGVSSQLLREVTVSQDATQVSLALDKKVYRVDRDGIAAGGTAEDALRAVPSIAVDIDGNVTLRNSAPQIFVDGRPTTLTVDQIPADAIDNIEVITNPSAKYDASGGNAGIVNIVLKKERRIGYHGSVRAGVDSRGRVNGNGDINARQGKVNLFLGGGYNQRRSINTGETDRQNLFGDPLTNVFQENRSEMNGFFAHARTGMDWFITNRHTLSLSANLHGGDFEPEDRMSIHTDSLFAAGLTASDALRTTLSHRQFRNYGGQMLYKYLFPKEGREWTADLNYNASRSENGSDFTTDYSLGGGDSRQKQEGSGDNRNITAQTDYVNPITASMKLEMGGRAALRRQNSDNMTFQYDNLENDFVRVPGFADRYRYDDQVYAAYTTLSHSFARWGYQVGLRAESSFYTGELLDVDSVFTNDYPINLFPSAFLTYKLNESDNLQLNYSRRINRPNFFQLLPFPDFSDSLMLSRGNPALQPEFTNSLEASYQNIFTQGHNLLVSVYYKQSDNLITRYQFSEYNEFLARPVIVSTFVNSNRSQAYGTEMTLKNTLWKILDLTTNVNLYNSLVDASNLESDLRTEQFTWFIKENLTVRLPESFTFQASGEYQSRTAVSVGGGGGRGPGGHGGGGWGGGPSSTAQGYSLPNWFVDLSLRKDLWKRTATISLNVQDVLRTRRQGTHTESEFFIQDTWRRRDPQVVRLNFSWRFGKFDQSLFRRKNTRSSNEGMEEGF
jgi:outer membrane receptor protein involved in Fe transport